MDDAGKLQFNRGWRVEFNSVLGPYKGGLRFHPTANEGILKFLGFEQIFKNALTGLAMGGGKGGSDFNPKGKSDAEVIRFCQSFMTELARYLHPSTDVPAGDIGVGGREIGAMYGQYKRLKNKHGEGILTGKGALWGGSPFRPEATGYGLVYIMKIAVEKGLGKSMEGMRCALSGSGNVCQYAAQKCIEFGAKVVSVSDSTGCVIFEDGMTTEQLAVMIDCKEVKRARLSTLTKDFGTYHAGESPWSLADLQLDLALPCATQNEINGDAATRLVKNGVKAVGEGANLPTNMAGRLDNDKDTEDEVVGHFHQLIHWVYGTLFVDLGRRTEQSVHTANALPTIIRRVRRIANLRCHDHRINGQTRAALTLF